MRFGQIVHEGRVGGVGRTVVGEQNFIDDRANTLE